MLKVKEARDILEVDFRISPAMPLDVVFEAVKQYRDLGLIGEDSYMSYHGVRIPVCQCHDFDDVMELYCQRLTERGNSIKPSEIDDFSQQEVVALDFRAKDSSVAFDYLFEAMKQYQKLGYAGYNSHIIYQGVSVPAGYCDNGLQAFGLYYGVFCDEPDKIQTFIPEHLDQKVKNHIVASCLQEKERLTSSRVKEGTYSKVKD